MNFTKLTQCVAVALVGLLSFGCASTGTKNSHKLSHAERARLYIEMAMNSIFEKKSSEALALLVEAEKEDDSLPEIYHTKALAYHLQKQSDKAIEAVRHAVELDQKYSDAYTTLGKLLLDVKNYKEAEKALLKAANDESYLNNYKPKTTLGILYYRSGDYKKAQKFFDRAIHASPNSACIAYYYMGHLELRESHFKSAIKNYDQARSKLCANFVDAHYALGLAYERDKQYDRARRVFLDVQDRFPNTMAAESALKQLKNLP